MSQAEILTRLASLAEGFSWPSTEFDGVQALIADIKRCQFDEAAYLEALERQWEDQQGLAHHDRADFIHF